jgi:protein-disulfide isomerase
MDLLRAPVNELDHVSGTPHAPVVMIQYGDYECHRCVAAHDIIKEIRALFGSSMCFIFRNFPITYGHPHSLDAAAIAELAADQGHYWKAHDAIFERTEKLNFRLLESIAKSFDISICDFLEAYLNKRILKKIRLDSDGGLYSGVGETPAFFINGHRYRGPLDVRSVCAFIEDRIIPYVDGGIPMLAPRIHST